jgi:hypothetical protein
MVVDGVLFFQTIPPVVKQYAERLLVDEDLNLIGQCCMDDTLDIEETILGFFQKAKKGTIANGSPTTSSSRSTENQDLSVI